MLKIKQLRVYQPVHFENVPHTYFNNEEWAAKSSANTKAPIVSMQETEEGVLLKTEKDIVKVFRTNIAYISYFEEQKESAVKPKAK